MGLVGVTTHAYARHPGDTVNEACEWALLPEVILGKRGVYHLNREG